MGVYWGGVPTEPDVNRLLDKYPQEGLHIGRQIPYAETESVISIPKQSSRWATVTKAWRKKVETDFNIIIACMPENQAFVVLSEGEKVLLSRQKLRSSVKFSRRSMEVSARVDLKALTDDERKNHDFNCSKAAAVIASGQLRNGRKSLPDMGR